MDKPTQNEDFGQAINYGWTVIIPETAQGKALWGTIDIPEYDILAWLHADAKASLPLGTRYQIRRRIPGYYGRSFGLAWYSCHAFADRVTWGVRLPIGMGSLDPQGGFYLVGEFTTGDSE